MIGRIVMTRIEPCFWGNKPANGEVSKVKKDASVSNNTSKATGVDTFTASDEAKKSTNKTESSKQK